MLGICGRSGDLGEKSTRAKNIVGKNIRVGELLDQHAL